MAECEHLARTSAYFDGALAVEDEEAATSHLATCEQCQALLADAVAIDAAVSRRPTDAGAIVAEKASAAKHSAVASSSDHASGARAGTGEPRDELAARRARRRWPIVAAGAVAIAAAALLVLWLRSGPRDHETVAIALAPERAVEARFTGGTFAAHRPLGALRGDKARETIPLATLAELEKRGAKNDLLAAVASGGDLARAEEIAAGLGDDAAAESDRAALAMAAGDPERALQHAQRAVDRLAETRAQLPQAWWNLGLAARDLGLPRVAADAFAHVSDAGWADEARAIAAPLHRELERQGAEYTDLAARGRAMIAGGAAITVEDVRRFPGWSRIVFDDALRLAGSPADAHALGALAGELDAASSTSTATAAIDRVAAADFAVRTRFTAGFRALVQGALAPDARAKLLADLRTAGAPVADIYLGAASYAGETGARADELLALVKPWNDPWFELYLERERIRRAFPGTDLRAEAPLAAALARCAPAWAVRCGALARELAVLLDGTGRTEEAEAQARAAVDAFRRAMVPPMLHHARSILANIHRDLGRSALARAELDEVVLAEPDCDTKRYAQSGRAYLAFIDRNVAATRTALPSAAPPAGCRPRAESIGLAIAVDLARLTNDAGDRANARAWIAEIRRIDDALATVADARLSGDTGSLRTWLRAHPATAPAVREYGYTTLETAAGAAGDWAGVVALAVEETPLPSPPCTLVANSDDDVVTVAARTDAATTGAQRRIPLGEQTVAAIVPPDIVRTLTGCTGIAVIARTPLHGRFDLLPPELPWWFAGEAHAAPATGPARAVQVIDARPPAGLVDLPRLPQLAASQQKFDVTIAGADATPSRVLRALGDASYAELHVHGVASAADAGAAFLALSPEPTGEFALRAAEIRKAKLASAPLVVLAACRAAAANKAHERFSLPDAFLVAGARAVVAADAPIPDAAARAVFDDLHKRIAAGELPAAALAAIRKDRAPGDAWARHLMLFQ